MRCERRWTRWLVAAAVALLAVACGDGADPGAGPASPDEAAPTSEPTTTTEATSGPGGDDSEDGDGDDDDRSVAEAPAVGIDVEELCDRLADVDLDELFSEDLRRADPGTQRDDGCAYASEVVDGEIVPDVEALVTVVRTVSEPGGDTVAGEAGRGLPDLEGLPELGDQGAMTAFRTENEYIDTWEAWAFLALEDGLLRIHTRDPAWDDEQDALEATRDLLEALDVATT